MSERDKTLVTQSRFLADVARRKIAEGDRQTAMLLALEALPDRNANEEIRGDRPRSGARDRARRGLAARRAGALDLPARKNISAGRYSADGSLLLTTVDDVRLWDVATGSLLLDAGEMGFDLAKADFALRDELLILSDMERRLVAWDVKSRRVIYSLDEVADYVLAANGLAVTRSPFPDNVMAVRDIRTGRQLCVLARGLDPLPVLMAGGDRIVTWQESHPVLGRAYLPCGDVDLHAGPHRRDDRVTTDGTPGGCARQPHTITLWDVPNRRLLWTVEGGVHSGWAEDAQPRQHKLVAYTDKGLTDKAVVIVDIASGRGCCHFPGHRGRGQGRVQPVARTSSMSRTARPPCRNSGRWPSESKAISSPSWRQAQEVRPHGRFSPAEEHRDRVRRRRCGCGKPRPER